MAISTRRIRAARDISVSTLGFGAAPIGNLFEAVSPAEAAATGAAAWDAGVRYFDTAPHYGHGLSESRLGAILAGRDRAGFTLSTKVGRVLQPVADGAPVPDWGFVDTPRVAPVYDYSAAGIRAAYQSSLTRLGIARADVLYLHDIGRLVHKDRHAAVLAQALKEALPEMRALQAEGGIDAIGLGVNEVAVCEEVLAAAPLDVILLAGRYTLLEQQSLPFMDACAAAGVSIVIGGPFNSGVLADPAGTYNYGHAPEAVRTRVAALAAACAAYETPLPAAALQFPLAHRAVASVIPGARSAVQMRQIAEWAAWPIPDGLWPALKEKGLIAAAAPTPEEPAP